MIVLRYKGVSRVLTGRSPEAVMRRARALWAKPEWTVAADMFVRQHYREGLARYKHPEDTTLSAADIAEELTRRFGRRFTKGAVISRYNRKLKHV